MDSSNDQKTHYVPSKDYDNTERDEDIAEKQKENQNNDTARDFSSPGKIFIGGLSKSTTTDAFTKHFSNYGELTDSVIIKDRVTGEPRGFGFVTYADPSVVDKVIEDTHILDGKTVEIKRTIPRGNTSNGPRTRKIFVGGIPKAINDDEFKKYFDKFGKIVEHQIVRNRRTGKSRGFGFITFDSEQDVEEIISKGKMVELGGRQVDIRKFEPKKPLVELGGRQVDIKKFEPKKPLTAAAPIYGIDSRPPYVPGGVGDFRENYSGFGGAGYGNNQYMSAGGYGGRPGGNGEYGGSEYGSWGYGGYGGAGYGNNQYMSAGGYGGRPGGNGEYEGSEYGSWGYGGYGVGSLGGYQEDPSLGYGVRPANYGEGFGGYGGGMTGGYGGAGDGYGANGSDNSSGVGGAYRRGGAYGSGRRGSGRRTNVRYHPYARQN